MLIRRTNVAKDDGDGDGVGEGVGVGLATGILAFTSVVSTKKTCRVLVRNASPLVPHLTRLPDVPLTPEIVTKPSGRNVFKSNALI